MRSKLGLLLVIGGMLIGLFVWQRQARTKLQSENQRLQTSATLSERDLKELNSLKRLETREQEMDAYRDEGEELAALSEEIRMAEEAGTADERDEMLARLEEKRGEWEAAKDRAADVRANIEAETLRINTVNAMKTLGLAARIWATDNDDRLPDTFLDMTNELSHHFTEGFKGGLNLENFEWMPHARRVSEMEPQLALFREKAPRLQPDGKWERSYTLCDGSVQTLSSDTEDFSAVEQSMMASEPGIPEQFQGHPAYQ